LDQLPIFVNLKGRNVILVGEGEMADAKRRLIERAGGICVNADDRDARLAFVAIADEDVARVSADALKARGLLVNVVDRPEICDFTTPAIVDRTPVLVAVGTGGASAGMAKAIRQRIETLLPETLGPLANAIAGARGAIRVRWPEGPQRRRALDQGFAAGGLLDAQYGDAPGGQGRGKKGGASSDAVPAIAGITDGTQGAVFPFVRDLSSSLHQPSTRQASRFQQACLVCS
jgi:uroporphyrin-III C-methyltransferase/precorrin-2 dehydrogenase/sirohydrochlorin ferrochelatase